MLILFVEFQIIRLLWIDEVMVLVLDHVKGDALVLTALLQMKDIGNLRNAEDHLQRPTTYTHVFHISARPTYSDILPFSSLVRLVVSLCTHMW